jgi:hypothetical protein
MAGVEIDCDFDGYQAWYQSFTQFPPSAIFEAQHQISEVLYIRECTQVKIFFRLCLQNLFPSVHPTTGARVEAMVSRSVYEI